MADAAPPTKVDASPALLVPLALATRGYQQLTQAMAKTKAADKIGEVKGKVEEQYAAKKDVVLAAVGLVLILYGAQFKNLLLCTQVVLAFLYDRVKGAIADSISDVQVAVEKKKADAPAAPEPAPDAPEPANKHAKKREAKKTSAVSNGHRAEGMKEEAEAAKKVLKVLDQGKLSAAATEVLAALMACVLLIHGGIAQKVAISISLVGLVVDKVDAILEFPGYESMEAWTRLIVRVGLHAVALPLAIVATPLALAMNAAALGAKLATDHGCRVAEAQGRLKEADEFLASKKALLTACGLCGFGTLWQLWSWAAGSGLPWYVQLPLLPAWLLEVFLGLL